MSPVDTLPAEVLQLIFSFLASSTNQGEYRLTVRRSRIILPFQHVLMHVSRSWCRNAVSNSRLWTSIHLIWPSNDSSPLFDMADAIRSCVNCALRFSKNGPLDINISDRGWEEVGTLLLVYSHRWRTLSLGCTNPPQQLEFRIMKKNIPKLETFRFLPSWPVLLDGHTAYFEAISEVFEDAPALRRVDLNTQLLPVRFPWGQVVEVGLHHCATGQTSSVATLDTVRDVLASSTMRKLAVHGHLYIPTEETFEGLRLQELDVGHDVSWPAKLYLPSLRKVTTNGDNINVLLESIKLSHCSPTSLTIILTCISSTITDDLRSMVVLLCDLQRLEIQGHAHDKSSTSGEVDNLIAFLGLLWHSNVLPRLSDLVVSLTLVADVAKSTRFYTSVLHAVDSIITSAGRELRTVVVDLCVERFPGDVQALDLDALENSHQLRQLKDSLSQREGIMLEFRLTDMYSTGGDIFVWETTAM